MSDNTRWMVRRDALLICIMIIGLNIMLTMATPNKANVSKGTNNVTVVSTENNKTVHIK